MSTLTRILRLVAAGALVALAVAAPAGAATVKLAGGSTTLRLDAGTAKALKGLGVAVTPITPAKAGSKGVSFPITGGAIDPATAAGTITHSGGLQLRAGATRVRLTSFIIGVDKTPSLSVEVGQGAAARLHAVAGQGEGRARRPGHDRLRRRGQAQRQGRRGAQQGVRGQGVRARTAHRDRDGQGHPGADRLHRRSHLAGARSGRGAGAGRAGHQRRPGGTGDREPRRQPRLPHHRRQGRRQVPGGHHHPQRRTHADQGRHGGDGDRLHDRDRARAQAHRAARHRALRPRDARPERRQGRDLRAFASPSAR